MAVWEENKHPRDKSGQFTSKGNEGQGGKVEDFDNDFEEEFVENTNIDEIVSDNEYVYFGIEDKEQFIDLLHKRDNVPIDKAKEWVDKNWDEFQKYQNEKEFKEDNESEIDYENIEYPKGTSKEYTMVANKKYQNALPVLEKNGIKLEEFGEGKQAAEGGYEDNTEEVMEKYVFEPFRKKYPNGNNEIWEKEYQPLYDAIDAVGDKKYNDWWIKNKKDSKDSLPF